MSSVIPYFVSLPEEVMENIISYCDGKSLGNLLKTCRRWKHCIEEPKMYILKKWGMVCMCEMEKDFIIDILQNLYPKYWLSGELVCWKTIYKSWKQWYHLNFWSQNVEVLDKKTNNYVSSIKFSGNWIFIATKNEGSLEAVNYVTKQKVLLYQCNSIQDMYLRCYVSKKDITDGTVLQDVEHDEVVMVLMRQYVCFDLHTGQAIVKPKLRNFLTLKHFEGQEVTVINEHSPARVCTVNIITGQKASIQREEFTFCNIIQVWNGKILMLDYDERTGRIGEFKVTDYNLKEVEHPLTNYKLDMFEYLLNITRQHYHLGVFITLNNVEMEINVNSKIRKYAMFSHLACRLLCATYYAGVLFIGSDIGVIYAYRVSCDEELLHLNLSEYNCCIDIGSHPILALDVKDTFVKPILAAASEHKIHLIRFQ